MTKSAWTTNLKLSNITCYSWEVYFKINLLFLGLVTEKFRQHKHVAKQKIKNHADQFNWDLLGEANSRQWSTELAKLLSFHYFGLVAHLNFLSFFFPEVVMDWLFSEQFKLADMSQWSTNTINNININTNVSSVSRSYPVQICLRILWKIKIDDNINSLNIDSPCKQICKDRQINVTRNEGILVVMTQNDNINNLAYTHTHTHKHQLNETWINTDMLRFL